jgi:hypothetical protein
MLYLNRFERCENQNVIRWMRVEAFADKIPHTHGAPVRVAAVG